jgi:hypothetical protein
MRTHKLLKLLLLLLLAPLFLIAWAMVCAGAKKDIHDNLLSSETDDIRLRLHSAITEETPEARAPLVKWSSSTNAGNMLE